MIRTVAIQKQGCIQKCTKELLQSEKELVKIVDFMSRETEFKPNTPLIFIYSDGSRERVMKIEE